jgi:hypothetical protein
MFWNNLAVAANFFLEIAVELIVLFTPLLRSPIRYGPFIDI